MTRYGRRNGRWGIKMTDDYENDTPPERIWLQFYNDEGMFECEDEPELNTGLLASHPEERYWCSERVFEHDVEYIKASVHDAEVARLSYELAEALDKVDAYGRLLLRLGLNDGAAKADTKYYTGNYILDECLSIMTTDEYLSYGGKELPVAIVVIGKDEVVWQCDGDNCETHGIVPAEGHYVPGWTWDDDGKWYCPTCGERLGLF